ncbi:hypothetical protein KAF25_003948 [Fusarium avenaceum]|uniref:Uncharacterized protein n=1 Tax=Fusarium avenaceum TaxID=40199 RepID=A0A9P7GSX2_9HYPO|nr:hypothetical protein KAF25_003948 [Fusarium avenaceum]
MFALRHLTAALLTLTIEWADAGPCRPVPISIISSSTFDISLSSTLAIPESTSSADSLSDISTASYLYTDPTTNAVTFSLSTSIATSFESTATVFTTSTKPQDTVISTTLGTTVKITVEGSQGTTEATSIAKATTETTSGAVNPTAEETTSTAFKTATVSTATGTTSEVLTTSPGTTTTATAESTSEPATSSIETTTTTAAAPVSTTFNLIMQGGRPDGVVLHSDGQYLQLRTSEYPYPYPATYPEAALSYDQDTQHLLIGEKPLCIYYDTVGIIAAISACQGIPTGQYAYLTCDPPSNSALTCNVPGKRYDQTSASLVDLGLTWSQFYYLEGAKQMPGLGWIIIGRAGLTSNDIKYNNFDPINIITRVA